MPRPPRPVPTDQLKPEPPPAPPRGWSPFDELKRKLDELDVRRSDGSRVSSEEAIAAVARALARLDWRDAFRGGGCE